MYVYIHICMYNDNNPQILLPQEEAISYLRLSSTTEVTLGPTPTPAAATFMATAPAETLQQAPPTDAQVALLSFPHFLSTLPTPSSPPLATSLAVAHPMVGYCASPTALSTTTYPATPAFPPSSTVSTAATTAITPIPLSFLPTQFSPTSATAATTNLLSLPTFTSHHNPCTL